MSEEAKTKCVRDAHGACSRWCTHPNARPGMRWMKDYGKSSERADEVEPEQFGTLKIDGKMTYEGHQWDVNNVRRRLLTTNHVAGEQDVELVVVLTRPIPKQEAN